VRDAPAALVEQLGSELRLNPLIARVLVARGQRDAALASRFLRPQLADLRPPAEMAALPQAVGRLARAFRAEELVGVFGDYDVDGVTSAALIGDYLVRAGARVTLRVARRDEGYGFGPGQALELAERGVQVLVLTDCGTSDVNAVGLLAERGIDVIAVDHHRVISAEELTTWPGYALVNPQRPDCGFPFKGLCSAGLSFYLMAALRRELGGENLPDPRDTLDLVALGTVADVAPLIAENRILVARGLETLATTSRPGLRALMGLAGVEGRAPSADDIGWRLGPRLNAPGRLGDAGVALSCLTERDPARALDAAERCVALNEERKSLQERMIEQAFEQVTCGQAQPPFVLVAGDDWHPGIIGIVAGRVADRCGCPAAAVAWDGEIGRGSARGVHGIDLVQILGACETHLVRYGGHAAAAGFTVERSAFGVLESSLRRVVAGAGGVRGAVLEIDAMVLLADLSFELHDELQRLGPFGEANPAPICASELVRVESAGVVGNGHLRLIVSEGQRTCRAIGFGLGDRVPAVGDRIDLAYVLEVNEYRGRELQLRLLDWRASDRGPEGMALGSALGGSRSRR
jgi:single-stranded-DNA-specific exonuclease